MCDFRKINKIRFLDSGKVLDVSNSTIDITCDELESFNGEPGFYHVGCSGCGYQYYDGKFWLREKNDNYPDKKYDYEVIDFTEIEWNVGTIVPREEKQEPGDWDE